VDELVHELAAFAAITTAIPAIAITPAATAAAFAITAATTAAAWLFLVLCTGHR
jgi:hypothetical protein